MKITPCPFLAFAALACLAACSDSNPPEDHTATKEAIPNEINRLLPLPKDVIYTAHSLINGSLYARPSFDGTVLARFDTSQRLYVVDTTDNVFVKAHLLQDTALQTGYIPKAILPEQVP